MLYHEATGNTCQANRKLEGHIKNRVKNVITFLFSKTLLNVNYMHKAIIGYLIEYILISMFQITGKMSECEVAVAR